MKNTKVFILLVLLILVVGAIDAYAALEICEDKPKISTNCSMITPSMTCSSYNYSIVNKSASVVETGSLTHMVEKIYRFNFTQPKGTYLVVLCDGAVREIVVKGADDDMGSLSVTLFILLITAAVFAIPITRKKLSENDILNHSLKGCCYVFGLFLLSLDTAMIATLADNADLGITTEIFRYLWIINWTTYIAMIVVVLGFGYKALQMWGVQKEKKSMGEE